MGENMCSKDKIQLVRELVNNGSLQQYMFHHDEFTKSELYEIFYILKKMGLRETLIREKYSVMLKNI